MRYENSLGKLSGQVKIHVHQLFFLLGDVLEAKL